MYSRVDLSLHNEDGLYPGQYCKQVLADNPYRLDFDVQDRCEAKQLIFINAINQNPEYARYVIRLTWTIFSRPCKDNEERLITEEPVWKAFKLLRNVKYLDIASLACHRERVAPPPAPSFFPKVTHLRMSGQMSWTLVRTIIDSLDPAQLVSLECNNLQDFGQCCEGNTLVTYDLSTFPEFKDSLDNDVVRHPGVMRGHLRRLEGRCSKLRHLCLRSVGQDGEPDDIWSPTIDVARYQEWASFINSVRPTLNSLIIDQGLAFDHTNIDFCRGRPSQVGRPMDTRFAKYLLPVLASGKWPCLKDLGIYGVGGESRYVFGTFYPGEITTSSVKLGLSESTALRGVNLDVRGESTKASFYIREMSPCYEDPSWLSALMLTHYGVIHP